MSAWLELLDYRRRVHALYAEVRASHARHPVGAHAHWRSVRDELFAGHPQSPLSRAQRRSFAGLRYHAYDPDWAFVAPVSTAVEPERYPIATSAGKELAFVRVGVVDLPVGQLDLFWLDAYGGGLFLPFRDATAGSTTYGGGRYLLDTAKGADLGSTTGDELVVDFNFAYHPSCHYRESWECPLAPPGSRLEVAVAAGELAYEPG